MIANTIFKGILLKLLSVNGLLQENTESIMKLAKVIRITFEKRNSLSYLVTLKIIYYVT